MSAADDRLLVVLTGPSGAGKTSILRRAEAELGGFRFSVSCTTRSPRGTERDGVDYRFLEPSAFRAQVAAGAFIEWADVHGVLYGTPRSEMERAAEEGVDLLLDIDVQGGLQVMASGVPAVTVFIAPPDLATLEARLRGRATDAADVIARRLADAADELRVAAAYDYVIVNDDLDEAVAELISVFRAERLRAARRRRLRSIQRDLVATQGRP